MRQMLSSRKILRSFSNSTCRRSTTPNLLHSSFTNSSTFTSMSLIQPIWSSMSKKQARIVLRGKQGMDKLSGEELDLAKSSTRIDSHSQLSIHLRFKETQDAASSFTRSLTRRSSLNLEQLLTNSMSTKRACTKKPRRKKLRILCMTKFALKASQVSHLQAKNQIHPLLMSMNDCKI